jgi:citrate synthase
MENKYAELTIEGKTYKFPIVEGTEGEKGIDISLLRKETGFITLDPSFGNTGACYSNITYIDGENGILRYRGYPIAEIAEKKTFIETAYLLLHDEFPKRKAKKEFSLLLTENSLLHEDMIHFFHGFPQGGHPMHILSTMINALSTFYPHVDSQSLEEDVDKTATKLISKLRTIAAFAYKKSIGKPIIYPRHDLSYCANFLNMMFDSPVKHYKLDWEIIKILNLIFILHADHEQNCSTTTVKVIGSAQVNLYATISAGISALSGPLHGGASQAVITMLQTIYDDNNDLDKYIAKAKDKTDSFKLMGFGHRVYKNFDPRATIVKKACHRLLGKLGIKDPLLELALQLEERALLDEYFIERKLYPNVDFYTGIIYKAIGIPEDMFTVMFVLGRLPGWIAQWKEMVEGKNRKIVRPRQIYIGKTLRHLKKTDYFKIKISD